MGATSLTPGPFPRTAFLLRTTQEKTVITKQIIRVKIITGPAASTVSNSFLRLQAKQDVKVATAHLRCKRERTVPGRRGCAATSEGALPNGQGSSRTNRLPTRLTSVKYKPRVQWRTSPLHLSFFFLDRLAFLQGVRESCPLPQGLVSKRKGAPTSPRSEGAGNHCCDRRSSQRNKKERGYLSCRRLLLLGSREGGVLRNAQPLCTLTSS